MNELFEICVVNFNTNSILEPSSQLIRLIIECPIDSLHKMLSLIPIDENETGDVIVECINFLTKTHIINFKVLNINWYYIEEILLNLKNDQITKLFVNAEDYLETNTINELTASYINKPSLELESEPNTPPHLETIPENSELINTSEQINNELFNYTNSEKNSWNISSYTTPSEKTSMLIFPDTLDWNNKFNQNI